MSGDGAHMGVGAARALDTILGGADQPAAEERMTPDAMRASLLACEGPSDYDGTARYAARLVLEAYLADPHLATLPMDSKREWPDGYSGESVVVQVGLWDVLKERGNPVVMLDLTGFMWGWAVNAARYCVEVEPQPNPAIIDL